MDHYIYPNCLGKYILLIKRGSYFLKRDDGERNARLLPRGLF